MPHDLVPVAGVDIRPEDIEAVATVLASGRLRQGRVVAQFEEPFAELVEATHAVAVSSGTAALHLAYLSLFRPGEEVIVPSFTFFATATMLVAVGAVPVFADVDQRTFTLAVDDVRSKITDRTRGIAGVHLFGNACDVGGLTNVATEKELTLVWDAAQALGTDYKGLDVGAYPSVSCYSFYPTKNITTGEGGMVTTGDGELARMLRLFRSQGAEGKYVHTVLGFNLRMTDFQAALGLRQLARLDEYLARRRANATLLSAGLAGLPGVIDCPVSTEGAGHSFNQYSVLVRAPLSRDAVADGLRGLGIETAVHYPRPLHRQPVFDVASGDDSLPNSDALCPEILALPVHPQLTEAAIQRTASAVVQVVQGMAAVAPAV